MKYKIAREYPPTPHDTNIIPAEDAVKQAMIFFILSLANAQQAIQNAVHIPTAIIVFFKIGKHSNMK